MSLPTNSRDYNSAIEKLNSCQSGFATLEARRQTGKNADDSTPIEKMQQWLRRIGYEPCDLDRLNIVHVAGTKGKGTTCAFVNSILIHCSKTLGRPQKIGLYTSPHLVSVRERIRINSEPIAEDEFAKYFFEVWEALERTAAEQGLDPAVKPAYFRFLTLMSFHVFMQEGVDAAVYEVGVGGENDSTNIIVHPAVTGITTLGIDHVGALGDSIEQIAWHKAGIFKVGSPAFSVRQVEEAGLVLSQRAEEKEVHLQWVDVNESLQHVCLKPAEDFQYRNASLAIVLATEVLKKFRVGVRETSATSSLVLHGDSQDANADNTQAKAGALVPDNLRLLPKEFVQGLEGAVWRARCETKVFGSQQYHLDGAHTEDSLEVACAWFHKAVSESHRPRILVFNQQSHRDASSLMRTIYHTLRRRGVRFQHVIFCTNVTYKGSKWKLDFVNNNVDPEALRTLSLQKQLRDEWLMLDSDVDVLALATIEDAQERVQMISDAKGEVDVLVTGSFHLVGGFISLLEGQDYGLKSTTRFMA